MKLSITRGFCLGHGIDVYPGDVIDIEEITAMQIIASGKAKPAPSQPAPSADEPDQKRKGRKHATE